MLLNAAAPARRNPKCMHRRSKTTASSLRSCPSARARRRRVRRCGAAARARGHGDDARAVAAQLPACAGTATTTVPSPRSWRCRGDDMERWDPPEDTTRPSSSQESILKSKARQDCAHIAFSWAWCGRADCRRASGERRIESKHGFAKPAAAALAHCALTTCGMST